MMLQLKGIWAGYGDATVLRNVTLSIPPGSVVALLGPNGAGKTTLVRVASGLLRPSDGTVSLDDTDVTGAPPHVLARRGICHVPEGRGVFTGLTVRENLVLHSPAHTPSEAVDLAVSAFPALRNRLDQPTATLSGGEQQMVAVARAYLADPKFVLLDEVSLGLAPIVVDEIFDFLRQLTARGVALLLIEQYVTRALAMADFVNVLERGRIAFAGERCELDEDRVLRSYVGTDGASSGRVAL
jgi:branched-chain amino acid transport system ATP-binding protein